MCLFEPSLPTVAQFNSMDWTGLPQINLKFSANPFALSHTQFRLLCWWEWGPKTASQLEPNSIWSLPLKATNHFSFKNQWLITSRRDFPHKYTPLSEQRGMGAECCPTAGIDSCSEEHWIYWSCPKIKWLTFGTLSAAIFSPFLSPVSRTKGAVLCLNTN